MMHAYFGAGCFWGVEAEFRKLDGVSSTSVGYMGGITQDPTYEEVCTGTTGHAEVVEIEYDENMVSYNKLLDIFMNIHDPTQLNRQGPDIGTQYRSAIFVINNDQKELANEMIDKMNKNLNDSVVTSVEKKTEYYIGEEYHQKYLEKRGLASCHTNLM
ncbi:MAG: peptide-methionine (S)-S-oxide reductase [Candidatus Actinomarinales bacterium]|nr:MAG: peptide-methionine (S)-S-oxide reductase [Candidatus Actinomarinales bacterium]